MKIALAQINPIIGDFEANYALIEAAVKKAQRLGARLCALPELAVCGYPPHDLLERKKFVNRNLETLEKIAQLTDRIAVVVGYVDRISQRGHGKPLRNAVALIDKRRVVSTHGKMLLPTYDVFDERRWFEPAHETDIVELDGVALGLSVCEDIWNVPGFREEPYERDPVAEQVAKGARILINVSASPFTLLKRTRRREMLVEVARRHQRPVLFVNQVGGNDDLIFDGRSLAIGPDGAVWAAAAEFEEDLIIVDTEAGRGTIRPGAGADEDAAIEALTLGVKDYARKCGFSSAVIGLSGGVDSALVAAIAARAFGPQNVHTVAMPSRFSSPGSLRDAEELAKNLGVRHMVLGIEEPFGAFLTKLSPAFEGRPFDVAEENIQARCRGVLLMALSNKFGHLLLSTGNKSEMAVGYATLYGDMAGGLAVLSDVPKTMVYRLCERLNAHGEIIPRSIIEKPPSAELRENQTDQDSLPPYDVLDAVLERLIDLGWDVDTVVEDGFDEIVVKEIARLVRVNEYKRRQAPPGLKVTGKAFGMGRRFPLAQRWPG